MAARLSFTSSEQEYHEENVGHMHGGGPGRQTIMIFLKSSTKESPDLSTINWALNNVAGRGDSVIVVAIVHELKNCCPKLPFRTTLNLMCQRICPNADKVPIRRKLVEEQIFQTRENYRKFLGNQLQPYKTRDVKFRLDIIPNAGHSLRQVAVQKAWESKAEWIILDRHLRKERRYLVKRLPCNLVLMTESHQGSILKLGPGWRLQRGHYCSEACGAEEKSVSGLVLPDLEKDHPNHTTSEDSDYTGSGDSDLSSHGGLKHQVEDDVSKEEGDLTRIRKRLPPLIVEPARYESEISKENEEEFLSPKNSPHWSSSSELSNHDQESDSSTPNSPEQEIGSSPATRPSFTAQALPLHMCPACNYKVPYFGPPKRLSLDDIIEATKNFAPNNYLMDCNVGSVYKGFLKDGQAVTVRRLDAESEAYPGDAEFCSEIEILSLANHVNIITLVGFCIDRDERILVFEFACNNALSWHLSPLNSTPITWSNRMRIALKTARGLRYLHEECRAGSIAHGSVVPKSILLRHDFSPKLCDFGQANLRPHSDKAAPLTESSKPYRSGERYRAPEIRPSSSITAKSDVYSFGVLLLELIYGGRVPDLDPLGTFEVSFLDSVRTELYSRSAISLLDPNLDDDYDTEELHRMLNAASRCIQTDSSERPSMTEVLKILEGDQLDEELDEHFCWESSCGPATACNHLDTVSAGVMVF